MMIRSINGEWVETVDDVQRLANALEPGDVVSLRVIAPEVGEMIINYRACN